jgi:photosystem II stability/assembly factor-like uncharacterized protein
MRSGLLLSLLMLALAGCDRLSSAVNRDAGVDSLASQWERVDAGAVNFNAVAGSDPNNVIVVGDQGTILHWNGAALVREESGTTANLRGVAVADTTLAYAVGDQGTILRRQDEAWWPETPLTTAVLNGVCVSGGYAVAAGEQGTILIANQGVWALVPNKRNDNYYAVVDTAAGPIIVGSLAVVVQPNLAQATLPDPPPRITNTYSKTLAGAVRYGAGAYVVGLDGAVFSWNPGKGTRLDLAKDCNADDVNLIPPRFLRAVSMLGDTPWMVGHQGLVVTMGQTTPTLDDNCQIQNNPFTVWPVPDDRWLTGVYAAAADDVWIVGRTGLILRGPPGVRGAAVDGGVP